MADATEVSRLLIRFLKEPSPRCMKGSTFSVLVKASFPDFKPEVFDCRNLREFIGKYAADEIVEVGKAGMDVVYGLRSAQQQLFQSTVPKESTHASFRRGPIGQLLSNPRIWKTFATPDSPFRLFLIPESGDIRVVHPRSSPLPNWQEIPRPSAETLLQFAKDFLSELPETQRTLLSATLSQTTWWIPFFDLLGTLGLKFKWMGYRRQRLSDEFARSVAGLQAKHQLQEDGPPLSVPLSSLLAAPTGAHSDSALKGVAVDVVRRMTDSELRALSLPLGYVLDALTTR